MIKFSLGFFSYLFLSLTTAAYGALIYTPANLKADKANLVVVIHGCLQSPESMALGTGWNQIADKNNLVILYPQIPEGSNPIGCWNWYLPENQRADMGQLKILYDQIKSVQSLLQLKDPNIYLAGISSGATTVAGLISCFPNEFTAAGIHSAPSYGLASNLFQSDRVLKEGPPENRPQTPCRPQDFKGSVILIHGAEDKMVNPKNTAQVIADFASGTKSLPPKEMKEGSISYQVIDYWDSNSVKLRFVNLEGIGHSWAGFVKNLRYGSLLGPDSKNPTQVPFFNKDGPSSTNLMWEFFSRTKTN